MKTLSEELEQFLDLHNIRLNVIERVDLENRFRSEFKYREACLYELVESLECDLEDEKLIAASKEIKLLKLSESIGEICSFTGDFIKTDEEGVRTVHAGFLTPALRRCIQNVDRMAREAKERLESE